MVFPVKDLTDVADKLGIIQAVKSKLIDQPDPAANQLLAALEEISKIYLAFEMELTRYLALTLEQPEIAEERKALLELEGGKVSARMAAARGHCGKIFNIYSRYLSAWLKRVLAPDEQTMMERLFAYMSLTDRSMLNAIDDVSKWLEVEAAETLNLVDAGDLQSAQKRVRAARVEVTPARKAISSAMRRLRDIEGDFVGASGAV